jgi:hypothetical protein
MAPNPFAAVRRVYYRRRAESRSRFRPGICSPTSRGCSAARPTGSASRKVGVAQPEEGRGRGADSGHSSLPQAGGRARRADAATRAVRRPGELSPSGCGYRKLEFGGGAGCCDRGADGRSGLGSAVIEGEGRVCVIWSFVYSVLRLELVALASARRTVEGAWSRRGVITGQHTHICVRHSSYGALIRGLRDHDPAGRGLWLRGR